MLHSGMRVRALVNRGPWQDHVGDFWDHRHDRNLLFLCYEDLHQVDYLML